MKCKEYLLIESLQNLKEMNRKQMFAKDRKSVWHIVSIHQHCFHFYKNYFTVLYALQCLVQVLLNRIVIISICWFVSCGEHYPDSNKGIFAQFKIWKTLTEIWKTHISLMIQYELCPWTGQWDKGFPSFLSLEFILSPWPSNGEVETDFLPKTALGNIWRHLGGHSLGWGCSRHLVVRGKSATEYPILSSPQKRIIWPQMSLVPKLKKKKTLNLRMRQSPFLRSLPFLNSLLFQIHEMGREQEAGRDQQRVK